MAWLCIDLLAVDDVDFSAAATLRETCAELKERHIRPVLSDANDHVRRELDVSGVTDLIGQDAYYLDLRSVLQIYQQQTGSLRLPRQFVGRAIT